jgi:hypothetical protein
MCRRHAKHIQLMCDAACTRFARGCPVSTYICVYTDMHVRICETNPVARHVCVCVLLLSSVRHVALHMRHVPALKLCGACWAAAAAGQPAHAKAVLPVTRGPCYFSRRVPCLVTAWCVFAVCAAAV